MHSVNKQKHIGGECGMVNSPSKVINVTIIQGFFF